MSVDPAAHFPLPSSPPSLDDLSPSSTLSPTTSPSSSDSLDSPSSLSAFLQRCREANSSQSRLLLASKLANVEDDDVKQRYAKPHTWPPSSLSPCDVMNCEQSKLRTAN